MTPDNLESIANRIDTGTENPDCSRALVVFNRTPHPLSGVAAFHASMSWPIDVPLPPVIVTDYEGRSVPSALRDLTETPDAKGRASRCQISFSLHFAVSDVPAHGWRTYIAAYSETPGITLQDFTETPGLFVVETLRHGGALPPVGTF